jgi:hypothetical protein
VQHQNAPREGAAHESPDAEHRRAVETLKDDHGTESGAPLAPHHNRTPAEQHRGGPLPNQKK